MEPPTPQQGFIFLSTIILMAGIGTGLRPADFRALLAAPRAGVLGLLGQLVLLPLLGLLLASTLSLSSEARAGVVLLCACPGGLMSNMLSLIGRGDVALSVALTTASTLLAALTLPLWLTLADTGLMADPLDASIRITVLALLPTLAGMGFRRAWPERAERLQRPLKWLVLVMIKLMILGTILGNRGKFVDEAAAVLPAVIALNLVAMATAGLLARLARLSRPQGITLTLEVGLQNVPLAMSLALGTGTLLAAVPAMIYGLWMMPAALLLVALLRWRSRGSSAKSQAA